MRYVSILNTTTGQQLATHAMLADSFFTRFLGLQGRASLAPGEGLVLFPTNSIHMFFMRMRIDALFVSANGEVVRVARALRPWTVGPIAPSALYCIELPVGTADTTEIGHQIALHPMDVAHVA